MGRDFGTGDICPCCGNEMGFDDDIDKPDIDYEEDFRMAEILKDCYDNDKEVPTYVREYIRSTVYTKEEAWSILRKKWIDKGFKWKCAKDKPKNWSTEVPIKQLLNINVRI